MKYVYASTYTHIWMYVHKHTDWLTYMRYHVDTKHVYRRICIQYTQKDIYIGNIYMHIHAKIDTRAETENMAKLVASSKYFTHYILWSQGILRPHLSL